MNIEVFRTKPEDIAALRGEMRTWEREFALRFGMPAIFEETALDPEALCWTAWTDGRITGIGGVKPGTLLCDDGYIWFAGAREVEDNTALGNLVIAKHLRLFADECKSRFSALWGLVCHEQPNAVKFTKWLGFNVGEPEASRGLTISRFWWRR